MPLRHDPSPDTGRAEFILALAWDGPAFPAGAGGTNPCLRMESACCAPTPRSIPSVRAQRDFILNRASNGPALPVRAQRISSLPWHRIGLLCPYATIHPLDTGTARFHPDLGLEWSRCAPTPRSIPSVRAQRDFILTLASNGSSTCPVQAQRDFILTLASNGPAVPLRRDTVLLTYGHSEILS